MFFSKQVLNFLFHSKGCAGFHNLRLIASLLLAIIASAELCMNKVAEWKVVRAGDGTTELAIIASQCIASTYNKLTEW